MKQTILGFILGVSIMLNIAAVTTGNLVVSKPAKPVSVISFHTYYEGFDKDVQLYTKYGYIVKTVTGVGAYGKILIVMEKY